MRKLSIFIMIIGVCIIGYSIFQIVSSNVEQEKSLAKAKELIELNENDPTLKDYTHIDYEANKGTEVGILQISKIDAELPIIEGVDEEELRHGVGHYPGTAFPSESDQVVLSGHRDTVFTRMGELEVGDIMTVQMEYGKFQYEIYETFIVDADDRTVIKSTAPDEVLTVTTCYPFNFIGSAPDRYIINAKPID